MSGKVLPAENDNLIARVRKAKGLSQNAMAEKMGCAIRSYRSYENGGGNIPSDMLAKMSEILGVSCDYLLGLTPYTHTENEDISKLTGLSDSSIEILRYYNQFESSPFDNHATTNRMCLDMVNIILEQDKSRLDEFTKQGKQYPYLFSLLHKLYRYIDSTNISVDELKDSIIPNLLTFESESGSESVNAEELYREHQKAKIIAQLERMREERSGEHGND